MEKMYDVICMGQVVQDIFVTNIPVNALTSELDSFCAEELLLTLGGDAANEASVLSSLGNKTALIARVGVKGKGNMLKECLEAKGVETSLLIRPSDCDNLSTVVVVKEDGNHTFFIGKDRNSGLFLEEVDTTVFDRTKVLSIGSLFTLEHLDTSGIELIARKAQEKGVVTVADMSFDLYGIGPGGLDKVYHFLDYLIPSYDEAMFVTGREGPEAMAEFFIEKGVKNVLIKLGEKGCFFKNSEKSFYCPSFKVTPIDTTGCGDAFVAGFIHSFLQGKSMEACAEYACAVGALNSQGIAGNLTIQSEEQVLQFMKQGRKNGD